MRGSESKRSPGASQHVRFHRSGGIECVSIGNSSNRPRGSGVGAASEVVALGGNKAGVGSIDGKRAGDEHVVLDCLWSLNQRGEERRGRGRGLPRSWAPSRVLIPSELLK